MEKLCNTCKLDQYFGYKLGNIFLGLNYKMYVPTLTKPMIKHEQLKST